jgi:hypothetical protein
MSIEKKNRILKGLKEVLAVFGKSIVLALAYFFEPNKRQEAFDAYFPNPYIKVK